MMSQRSLFLGDAEATIRRVNEAASSTLDVQRVSVWYCDPEQTKIWCVDLFQRERARHSSGTELFAKDFGPYFRALRAERTIAAHDARVDPRTSCFSEIYLEPLGITSLLDVPIWLGRRMVGVVCHEHVGPKRFWTKDEETFAYLMSNFVALALERAGSEGAPRTMRNGVSLGTGPLG
jgi:GAF domain-containing protein